MTNLTSIQNFFTLKTMF